MKWSKETKFQAAFLSHNARFFIKNLFFLIITIVPAGIALLQFMADEKTRFGLPIEFWVSLTMISLLGFLAANNALAIMFSRKETTINNEREPVTSANDNSEVNVENSVTPQIITMGENNISVGNNYGSVTYSQGLINKRPNLTKLISIRDEGQILKVEGRHLNDYSSLGNWRFEITDWCENMLSALGEIDRDKENYLRTLTDVPWREYNGIKFLNQTHQRDMDILSEYIDRLNKIIEAYLELPQ